MDRDLTSRLFRSQGVIQMKDYRVFLLHSYYTLRLVERILAFVFTVFTVLRCRVYYLSLLFFTLYSNSHQYTRD
jgi:hypothetical protein